MKSLSPLLASVVFAALSCACSAPGAGGSAASPAEFQPIASGDTLFVWSGGMDALLVDPKDAGVRDALHELGARLLELPAETGDPEFPADALELAADLFLGPMTFSIGPAEADSAAGGPVRGQMTFRGANEVEARRRADRLTAILSKYGVPSLGLDEATGLSVLDLGGVTLQHGVARAGRPDTLVVGTGLELGERELGNLDLPKGVAPAAAFRLDYGSLSDMLAMFGGPEATEAFRAAGLEDVVIQGAIGHGADRSFATVRMTDWVLAARTSGALPEGSIERAALELIPEDATVAIVARTKLGSITQALRGATEMGENMSGEFQGVDPLAMLREFTGVDLEADVIGNLGDTVGLYTSDSTGGGGFFSGVAFVRVTNEAALRAALERLEGRVEGLAADQGLHGFALRHSQHEGADITTITVSGWPIPVEPSWAIQGGWFFASASVQGLRAALDQAARPDGDLLDNERFRDQVTGSLDDLVSLSFVDVPRFARDGYPLAAMLGAAVSNGISSAGEPNRGGTGIVPAYAQFVRGARATLALGRVEGEDLVVRSQGDRSLLVQMAGMVGAMGPLPLVLAGLGIAGANEDHDEPAGMEVFEDESHGMDDDPSNEGLEPDEPMEDVFEAVTPGAAPAEPAPGDPK